MQLHLALYDYHSCRGDMLFGQHDLNLFRVAFHALFEVDVLRERESICVDGRSVLNRDHLLQALVPLYRGRIYSFLLKHQDSSPDEIEADSEKLCLEFERQKPYLVERWNVKT